MRTYDELLNEHSLADTCTTKETDLATTGVRSEQVDDLDSGLQDLGGGGLFDERGGVSMDGGELDALDGTTLVNGVTSDVDDTAKSASTDGDLDGGTSVVSGDTTAQTLSTWAGLAGGVL